MKKIELPMDEIVPRYKDGENPREIAEDFDCCSGVVRSRLKESDVEMRDTYHYKNDLPMQKVASRYRSGEGTNEIAEDFSCSPETVRRRLNNYGVEMRGPGGKPDLPKEDIINRYGSGESARQIADDFPFHTATIRRRLKEWGIELRGAKFYHREEYASFVNGPNGYEKWHCRINSDKRRVFPVHRLLAIAEYGIEAVKGKVVHHKNEVPWDNRVENIELMTKEEHVSHHMTGHNFTENRERAATGEFK